MNAVTEWLGHSAAVALKHYARVPEHLFARAEGGGAESGARMAQKAAQTGADVTSQKKTEATEPLGGSAASHSMTPRGFEPRSTP